MKNKIKELLNWGKHLKKKKLLLKWCFQAEINLLVLNNYPDTLNLQGVLQHKSHLYLIKDYLFNQSIFNTFFYLRPNHVTGKSFVLENNFFSNCNFTGSFLYFSQLLNCFKNQPFKLFLWNISLGILKKQMDKNST